MCYTLYLSKRADWASLPSWANFDRSSSGDELSHVDPPDFQGLLPKVPEYLPRSSVGNAEVWKKCPLG